MISQSTTFINFKILLRKFVNARSKKTNDMRHTTNNLYSRDKQIEIISDNNMLCGTEGQQNHSTTKRNGETQRSSKTNFLFSVYI